ncbi:MAG: MbnP family protein [Bacteroidota bacterium]
MNKLIKNNFNAVWVLLIAAAITGFSSCEKNKNEAPAPEVPANTPKGTFMFHLHTYLSDSEVDLYNITYTTTEGRNISLSMAQLYISEVQLEKLDGSLVDISGKKILKTFEAETFVVGDAPVGNYKSIRFKVGLNAATNQLSPTASSDSLILNKPAMWFGGSAQPDGYVFLNLQGMIDTSANMSSPLVPFVYKIGTNANYKQVIMPDKSLTITEGQVGFGHIMVDYNKLFTGIQLNQSTNLSVATAADNGSALAAAIVNNIPSIFIFEP